MIHQHHRRLIRTIYRRKVTCMAMGCTLFGFFSYNLLHSWGNWDDRIPGLIGDNSRNDGNPIINQLMMDPNSPYLLDQTDKRLWSYILANHIRKPSTLKYNFRKGGVEMFEPEIRGVLNSLFKGKKNGVFIEAGAYDGLYSHTLYFEQYYNWTGILIECNPLVLPKLKYAHRKAFIADVCLSRDNRARKANLTSRDDWAISSAIKLGGDSVPVNTNWKFTTFEVQTIPLYAIMAAINTLAVDLVVLDIQSMELDVIRAFPFHLVSLVKVWMIDVDKRTLIQREAIDIIMKRNGYSKRIKMVRDIFYVHESMN